MDDAQTVVGILGLEPRMTGPESVVLPLHHIPMKSLKKIVGILGLEPRMTGPESVVLPLHHIPIKRRSKAAASLLRVQSYSFFFILQLFHRFFYKKKSK